jgi:DNA-binding transcriptional ArsR family regulator
VTVTESDERRSLTLLELSDRELLLVLRDASDAQGWATALEISTQMGLNGNSHRSVSVRLSWLKRYGAVEREVERDEHGNIRVTRSGKTVQTQRWRMTDIGLAMATGRLKANQQRAFEGLNDGQMIMATRWLTQRFQRSAPTVAKLMDREYRHGVGRR